MAPPTTTIPQLPPRSAGPNAVRAYLTQILISKHDTTSEFAHKTANLWHLGRGAELRDSPPKVFRKLFGDYTGWVIYRIVYEDKLQEWKGSVVGLISSCKLVVRRRGCIRMRINWADWNDWLSRRCLDWCYSLYGVYLASCICIQCLEAFIRWLYKV